MARRRRIPDDPHSKPPSGLLSHVFSFVSREIESFVVNATAGPADRPGRIKNTGKRRGRDSERNMSEDGTRNRSKAHHRREHERYAKPAWPRPKPPSKSDATRHRRHHHPPPAYIVDDQVLSASDREHTESPTPQSSTVFPVPALPTLKKQPSLTMPGALFPRSPSLAPDQPDSYQCMQMTSNTLAFVHPSLPSYMGEADAGPSSTQQPASPLDKYVSPWRTRSVASVKDAVHRFSITEGAEADFSLMLPSPHSSPAKPVSKTRSVEEVAAHPPSSSATFSLSSRKGKERARDGWDDDDLDFIVCGGSEQNGVHAKERELDAARQEQCEHERRLSGDQSRRASDERERDKRRIKALEDEVRWLKEELSRSQVRSSPPPSTGPPSPPPPPPPPPPLRIDTTPYTPTTMFSSARASLRHAMTPIEAPINNPALNKTKRQGQPTVNVPSEKMAAFLHEIKTAKLRRVGSGANGMGGDGIAGPSGLSKSVIVTGSAPADTSTLGAKELLRRRSLANLRVPIGSALAAPVPPSTLTLSQNPEVRVGQKRKIDVLGVAEGTSIAPKRRMTQSSFQPSSGIARHTAVSSSDLSSLSLPSHLLLTNETDVATPSLCSDNDRDENSIEDRVPSTPPGSQTTPVTQKAPETDAHDDQIEVIDVDVEEHAPQAPRTISPSSVPRRTPDLFRKRPPTSPIPILTPLRPSAPARTKRRATPKPKSLPSSASDSDKRDGAPPPSPLVPLPSLLPVAKSKPSKSKARSVLVANSRPRPATRQSNGHASTPSGSGSNTQKVRKKAHKRRQTLDEEIRSAEARSSDFDPCDNEQDADEDVFMATGTKSKRRGFLAHGGGGGAPVFMGVGYVQGATGSADEDEMRERRPRRSSKSANQPCLIPRPKVKMS